MSGSTDVLQAFRHSPKSAKIEKLTVNTQSKAEYVYIS